MKNLGRLTDRISQLGKPKSDPFVTPPRKVVARNKRRENRVATYRDSTIHFSHGEKQPCILKDMSESGARVAYMGADSLPEYIHLSIFGERYLCRVVWRDQAEAGVEYCIEE